MTARRARAAVCAFALLSGFAAGASAQTAASTPSAPGEHVHPAGDAPAAERPAFIPQLTDEDRKAAFPELEGHTVHDRATHYFVLFDQLEWQSAKGGDELALDTKGWIGRDRDRMWFRAEGDVKDTGRIGEAEAHIFYGKQFSRWWDVVMGVRQDIRPGPAQTWAAVGVQGLAPYWFEVEATGYVGESGRTQARFEIEYELLFTNRLALQPLIEADLFGKSDPERAIGAGLSSTQAGLRLRYEFAREFAPYVGVVWNRKWGKTADIAEAAGKSIANTRIVTGLRLWF
jgi:copper resistance protein B